jgi:hypothetical protein
VLLTNFCLGPWAPSLPPCLHVPNPRAPASSPAAPQDTSRNDPRKRLRRFFESLYACLAKGARAVLQVYPANTDQAAMMTNAAMRAGFGGGLVVDFPHRCGLLAACYLLPCPCSECTAFSIVMTPACLA